MNFQTAFSERTVGSASCFEFLGVLAYCTGLLPSAGTHICQLSVLTYLLISWSRVLLGKLTGSQLVRKFPTFYGTRMFITASTSARHESLS